MDGTVQIAGSTVVDLTEEEAACEHGSLQVAVTGTGVICGVMQRGNVALGPAGLPAMLAAAQKLGLEVNSGLNQYVRSKQRT